MAQTKSHETFDRPDNVVMGSDRSFGLVFVGVLLVIATVKYWHNPNNWIFFWLAASAMTMVITLATPSILHPLNIAWFKFGLLLHKIVSPLIMGLLFYAVVTPIGLVMRARGKRPLNLALEPAASSYWVVRSPPGPKPNTFQNQF